MFGVDILTPFVLGLTGNAEARPNAAQVFLNGHKPVKRRVGISEEKMRGFIMAPTSQELTAIVILAIGVIAGIVWFLQAIKKEKEERKSESYRLWYDF